MPRPAAWLAVARCFATTLGMLARRELHQPVENIGREIGFADGTTGRVYRETTASRTPGNPCFLVVSFQLRLVHGTRAHALFRMESILNTPLFAGFPGFVSKLWLMHDANGRYRGLYEWDGPVQAEEYTRSLWRVLELVSKRGSIDYRVLPGLRRGDVLAHPDLLDIYAGGEQRPWWRVVAA